MAYDSTLSSTPACDSTLSSKISVGAMRMDVSSIQAPLRIRVATENCKDSPLSIQRSQSAGGVRRRNAEREGSHSSKDGNPLVDGRLTVRRMRRVDLDVLSAWAIRRWRPLFEGEMYYKVVTRLLICDRELLHRDYAVNLQLASINPVNGIAIIAALQIRY